MGLGALANAAETAYIQGVDLYGEQANRIITGFELNAGYVNAYLDEIARLGGAPPSASGSPTLARTRRHLPDQRGRLQIRPARRLPHFTRGRHPDAPRPPASSIASAPAATQAASPPHLGTTHPQLSLTRTGASDAVRFHRYGAPVAPIANPSADVYGSDLQMLESVVCGDWGWLGRHGYHA